MADTWIKGPQGRLEAVWTHSIQESSKALLMCHPHPQFGGTMNDRLLTLCGREAVSLGFSTLKFNFAGVGTSEGTIGGIEAAAADIVGAASALSQSFPEQTYWMGYSFGASAVLTALPRMTSGLAPKVIILVAPALSLVPVLPPLPANLSVFVVSGDQDQFVSVDQLTHYFGASSVRLIEGADHFFNGYDGDLIQALEGFLSGT